MQENPNTPKTRFATRLGFFVAGFVMAAWAPLVPYAKDNVAADDRVLGNVLLCLGIGSLIAMPLTGALAARFGARLMVFLGGLTIILALPFLAVTTSAVTLGLALLIFGAGMGTLDVAINIHAVEVERGSDRPLMSGFHALFSVGGAVGAGGVMLMLDQGFTPLHAVLSASALALVILLSSMRGLLIAKGGDGAVFALPRGLVLLLAILAAVSFLVEGAMLDWGAELLQRMGLALKEQAGIGYMLFAVAMTVGRFTGDRVVMALGDRRVLVLGGCLTIVGLVLLLTATTWQPAWAGFVLIGLGASNIVPVLFSIAGRQTAMAPGLAIAAVTTTGYAGILAGPAVIGYVAKASSLQTAFWGLVVLMVLVPAMAYSVTRRR